MYECVDRSHRRSAVGLIHTCGGGAEPMCLGCMVAIAERDLETTVEADSIGALQAYDVVGRPCLRLFFANNWQNHLVRCECSCAHEASIPYLEAAIREVHLMCAGCISAGHRPRRDD